MASSKTIAHSYILSLNADVAASARDSIVEALKQNGAKITNIIDYPGIMQAVSFEDAKAASAGQVDMQSDEMRINAWKSSLETYNEHIHALEQDQQVNIN